MDTLFLRVARAKLYKRRWGAETAYRKIGEFLPKTTSRSHVVRVFYFALAVLLYNVWVILKAHAEEHLKVIRLKLLCLWPLFSSIPSLGDDLPTGWPKCLNSHLRILRTRMCL